LDRRDWRTFRVDRVKQVRRTGHTFAPREHPDPGRLVSDAITSSGYHYQAVVAFQCTVEEVRRRVPPHVGAVETSADGAVLRIGADQAAWLTSYLIGLGLAFEVVSPPELREGVLAIAQRAAASHNTP
jgi:predicted DNA-binding transcriptional regulator YafY